MEFACKAGTAGMQVCHSHVKSGYCDYAMAIGADTAQGRPADALEYTAAAGGAAFIFGKEPIAELEHTCSYTTDTPDFWRREGEKYPSHGGRFTGEPGYFKHVLGATKMMLEETGYKIDDFTNVVLHMPNVKFPLTAAKKLGIPAEKMKKGLVTADIGNTYSGSSMLGLARVLDTSKEGDRILMTSFGSGAGSDSFVFNITDRMEKMARPTPVQTYIDDKEIVDYVTYLKYRKKIKM
jgi:hydroxymethylglutaryl-CoA synthase